MGYRNFPRSESVRLVKGYTLIEVLIAFTILLLFTSFAYISLTNIMRQVYYIDKQERNRQLVQELTKVYFAQKTGKSIIIEQTSRDNKPCTFYEYKDSYYTLCPEDIPLWRVYLSNGYNFLISK